MAKLILALIIVLSFTLTSYSQLPDNTTTEPSDKTLTTTTDSLTHCEYCGTYQLKGNPYIDEVNISMKDGLLIASAENYNDIVLEPTETDVYYVSDYHASIVFIRKESAITGIKIKAYSLKFGGEKL